MTGAWAIDLTRAIHRARVARPTKRTVAAVTVLLGGGRFRRALERHWHGGEKFRTRLFAPGGLPVTGHADASLEAVRRILPLRTWGETSTVWPTYWRLPFTSLAR